MSEENSFLVTTPLKDSFCQDYKGRIIYLGNKNLELLKKLNTYSKEILKINSYCNDNKKIIEDQNYLEKLEMRFFNAFLNL